jgi:hypothetical protein
LKDRFGQAAYLWTGARNLAAKAVKAKVDVDGRRFYKGKITCVLAGNVKDVFIGIEVFDGSRPGRRPPRVRYRDSNEPHSVGADDQQGRARSRGELTVRRRDAPIAHEGDLRQTYRLRARRRTAQRDKRAAHQGPTVVDHRVRSRARSRR